MLPIGRAPLGLLELLNLKGSGANPRSLSEALQGTLALDQLYLAPQRATAVITTPTITGNGFWSGTSNVPAGELWLVYNVTYMAPALAAGEQYQLAPALSYATGQQAILSPPKLWSPTDRPFFGVDLPQYRVLISGQTVAMMCTSSSSGATAFTFHVNHWRLSF